MEQSWNKNYIEEESEKKIAPESAFKKVLAKAKKYLVVGMYASLLGPSAKVLANPSNKEDFKSPFKTEKNSDLEKEYKSIENSNNTVNFSEGLKDTSILKIYDKSKTLEGGITPTGLSNSFLENPYGVKPEDILTIAKEYNLRITNEREFQEDLIELVNKNHPEIIKKTLEDFGPTAYGKQLSLETRIPIEELGKEGLKDAKLGVRTAFLIDYLKNQPSKPEKTIEHTPSIEESQPIGSYIINIRGDEKNNDGGYYFFENKEDFDRVVKSIDRPASSLEYTGDNAGQATYDMDLSIFNEYHAKPAGLKNIGVVWERSKENSKLFVPKKQLNSVKPIDRLGY